MAGDPFYRSKEWHKARAKVKARDFGTNCVLCGKILQRGEQVSVDHEPRKRNLPRAMWCDMSVLRLVHRSCHDSIKQSIEANSHRPNTGSDGFPIGGGW